MVELSRSKEKYTSCNFCSSNKDIHDLKSHLPLVVTICGKCLKSLKVQIEGSDRTRREGTLRTSFNKYEVKEDSDGLIYVWSKDAEWVLLGPGFLKDIEWN